MHLTISSVNYTTSTLYNYLVFITGTAFRVYPLIIMWILLLGLIASWPKLYFRLYGDCYFLHTQVIDENITRISISIQSPRRPKILIHYIFLYFCSQFVSHWFVCSVRQCYTVMYSPNVTSDVCVLYLCTLLLKCYLLLLKLLMTKTLKSFEFFFFYICNVLLDNIKVHYSPTNAQVIVLKNIKIYIK